MNCAWCDTIILPQISWENLFILEKTDYLCEECRIGVERIKGKRCVRCSRPSTDKECSDCLKWANQRGQDSLIFNYSLYPYNERMKEIIAKWKYRGDYYLGNIFKEDMIIAYKEIFSFLKKDVVAVPIPLSDERLSERGFNQAKMLAEFLPIKLVEALSRIDGEKQSKKTRSERIGAVNPFFVEETINKTVILVDDIYTTGTTLRHAASLLKEQGCPKIYSLTLIRG